MKIDNSRYILEVGQYINVRAFVLDYVSYRNPKGNSTEISRVEGWLCEFPEAYRIVDGQYEMNYLGIWYIAICKQASSTEFKHVRANLYALARQKVISNTELLRKLNFQTHEKDGRFTQFAHGDDVKNFFGMTKLRVIQKIAQVSQMVRGQPFNYEEFTYADLAKLITFHKSSKETKAFLLELYRSSGEQSFVIEPSKEAYAKAQAELIELRKNPKPVDLSWLD